MKRRTGLSFYTKEKKIKPETWKEAASYAFWIAALSLVAAMLVWLVGIRTSVIGISMEPTLNDGQEVFINKISYLIFSPRRNDVIVFRPNGDQNSQYYIKRVIGLPGETVQIKTGVVFINGEPLEEQGYNKIADPGLAYNEYVLEEDEFFVLGDNRNNSEDSRYGNIGSINKKDIEGKAWFKLTKENNGLGIIR